MCRFPAGCHGFREIFLNDPTWKCFSNSLLIEFLHSLFAQRRSRHGAYYQDSRIRRDFGLSPRAGDKIRLLVQVEPESAPTEIERVADFNGVDGIFVGRADRAASMGHLGDSRQMRMRAF